MTEPEIWKSRETGGVLEVKLNLDSDTPIELWLSFKSGNSSNILMSIDAAQNLVAKIQKLIKAYNEK